jgi:hypothetical protein
MGSGRLKRTLWWTIAIVAAVIVGTVIYQFARPLP